MTRLAVRLRAAFLSGLFLLGAVGVSLADAALFHEAGHDPFAGIIHVEPHGGAHHADRCTLAQPVPPQAMGIPAFDVIQSVPPVERHAALAPAPALRSTDPSALQRTRAPPA